MKALRRKALRARREMSIGQREEASDEICKHVIASRDFYSSSVVGCYLPMHDEVDTRAIIETAWRANKRIFVPILRNNREMFFCELRPETELEQNHFGVWEPTRGFLIAPQKLDIVITPTVAFDHDRHRIGMGGGYYDRCFSFLRHRKHWFRPKLVGIAFQCQEVEKISPNPWDIRLYRLISDKK
jgi:5-formyltetrahydrofolate cyclo-ligase